MADRLQCQNDHLWSMRWVRRSRYVSGRTEHHYCPVTSLNCSEHPRVKVSFWRDDRWWLHLPDKTTLLPLCVVQQQSRHRFSQTCDRLVVNWHCILRWEILLLYYFCATCLSVSVSGGSMVVGLGCFYRVVCYPSTRSNTLSSTRVHEYDHHYLTLNEIDHRLADYI